MGMSLSTNNDETPPPPPPPPPDNTARRRGVPPDTPSPPTSPPRQQRQEEEEEEEEDVGAPDGNALRMQSQQQQQEEEEEEGHYVMSSNVENNGWTMHHQVVVDESSSAQQMSTSDEVPRSASSPVSATGIDSDPTVLMLQQGEGEERPDYAVPWLADNDTPRTDVAPTTTTETPPLFLMDDATRQQQQQQQRMDDSGLVEDDHRERSSSSSSSLMEFAALAVRAVCPSEVTDVLCPTDIAEELFGDGDDILPPPPPPAPRSSSSPTTMIPSVGSWLSSSFFSDGRMMTPDSLSRFRLPETSPPATRLPPEEEVAAAGEFVPHFSQDHAWMGRRSVETLVAGYRLRAPVLEDPPEGTNDRKQHRSRHVFEHRPSQKPAGQRNRGSYGPNIALSLMAREITGRSPFSRSTPPALRLRAMGGTTLSAALDDAAGGIVSETVLLEEAMDRGDWIETETIVSRLVSRLIGDPLTGGHGASSRGTVEDPSLPPTAPRYYAGGGRLGLERDAFVLAGGVQLLLRLFFEEAFVGEEVVETNNARHLSDDLVSDRVGRCWNEVLLTLRELVYALPVLVENGTVLGGGDFLPFLFTLLAHDVLFDSAAALIEEILSVQSLAMPATTTTTPPSESVDPLDSVSEAAVGYVAPPTTFFLGNIPDLYELWNSFSCRQLAHFCRLLAFLIFEPEDRQALESPTVLKSVELLQLRRDRAVRAGRDATVDLNQALLMGDPVMMKKLLQLLSIMNFAPPLKRSNAYHVMAHFPFIADTLGMVGLNELDWNEITRLEKLARALASREGAAAAAADRELSELGNVTEMLENLSGSLQGDPLEPAIQLGHIVHVINAAQQAGVVVGRQRTGGSTSGTSADAAVQRRETNDRNVGVENLLPWADRVLVRRLYSDGDEDGNGPVQLVGIGIEEGPDGEPTIHHFQTERTDATRISDPEDAANLMQFNALILAPYQVEVLFILCTLLGGRLKINVQIFLRDNGLIDILDEMFHRMSWGASSLSSQHSRFFAGRSGDETASDHDDPNESPEIHGIHGPGCDCTPESALSVQFLRLLHNFCDRDCDNYTDRRLLLSESERAQLFSAPTEENSMADVKPGLLSKIIQTFMNEPDDSSFKFWLASCIESYLRGSSPEERVFAASSGLLSHIVEDIISDRLHCAGSLQTSFDLLGEICKGNADVLKLLMSRFSEKTFRRLMNVAASNLVDSNVFFRSLLLTFERLSLTEAGTSSSFSRGDPGLRESAWTRSASGFYLTHSWWDSSMIKLPIVSSENGNKSEMGVSQVNAQEDCPFDWFPTTHTNDESSDDALGGMTDFDARLSHFGWIYSPVDLSDSDASWIHDDAIYAPDTIQRLCWFLDINRARLLRDLLGVVDLWSINHENICCLNTAVVITILANRRNELSKLIHEMRRMDEAERRDSRQRLKNSTEYPSPSQLDDGKSLNNLVDRSFVQAMRFLDLDDGKERQNLDRRLMSSSSRQSSTMAVLGDRTDVLKNFRELLWFWSEYYSHRGRDRLSLEFSSHIRFQEWKRVVAGLMADDPSCRTSLVPNPIRLPKSPYERASRINDNPRTS